MPIRRTILLVGSFLVAALSLGCSRDWDAFDPRLVTGGPGSAGASASASSGMGGSGGGGQGSSSSSSSSGAGGAGGAGGSSCAVSLQDGFDDGAIDTVQWDVFKTNSNVVESNGNLVIDVPAATTNSTSGVLRAKTPANLSGCAVSVRVLQIPDPSVTTFASLALNVGGDHDEIVAYQGTMYFKAYLGGQHIDFNEAPYDPAAHAHWRIREQAGTTYWETSADGKDWQIQANKPNPLLMEAMEVGLGGGVFEPSDKSLGEARFDDLAIGSP